MQLVVSIPVSKEPNKKPLVNSEEVVTTAKVLKEPECLWKHIESFKGALSQLDDLPYSTYRLSPSIRDRLIMPELQSALRVKRKQNFNEFSHPLNLEGRSLMGEVVKKASDSDSTLHFQADGFTAENYFALDKGKWLLKTPEPALKDKQLAIYCSGKPAVNINVEGGKGKHIKAGQGIVFVAQEVDGKVSWSVVSDYGERMTSKETNPVLVDIDETTAKNRNWSCKGEFFLTPQGIQDLIKSKYGQSHVPLLCHYKMRDGDNFRTVLTGEGARNFLVPSETCEHTVVVRIVPDYDGSILVYIHETLGPDHAGGEALELRVIAAAQSAFVGHPIYLLKPGFTLQKDASCCTQFAYEAISAFASQKEGEMDSWLMSQAMDKDACINPEAKKGKGTGRSLRGKGEQPKAVDTRKDERFRVAATENMRMLWASSQDKSVVSIKGDEHNFLATCRRYQSLLEWYKLKTHKNEVGETIVTELVKDTIDEVKSQKTAKKEKTVTKFQTETRNSRKRREGEESSVPASKRVCDSQPITPESTQKRKPNPEKPEPLENSDAEGDVTYYQISVCEWDGIIQQLKRAASYIQLKDQTIQLMKRKLLAAESEKKILQSKIDAFMCHRSAEKIKKDEGVSVINSEVRRQLTILESANLKLKNECEKQKQMVATLKGEKKIISESLVSLTREEECLVDTQSEPEASNKTVEEFQVENKKLKRKLAALGSQITKKKKGKSVKNQNDLAVQLEQKEKEILRLTSELEVQKAKTEEENMIRDALIQSLSTQNQELIEKYGEASSSQTCSSLSGTQERHITPE